MAKKYEYIIGVGVFVVSKEKYCNKIYLMVEVKVVGVGIEKKLQNVCATEMIFIIYLKAEFIEFGYICVKDVLLKTEGAIILNVA